MKNKINNHEIKLDDIFSSKSNTLVLLDKILTKSKIEKIFNFTVEEWLQNQNEVLDKISKQFDSDVIVRSSAQDEDSFENSKAGIYESVLNVNPKIKTKVKGQDQVVGIKTKAQVVKNRLGPPLRTAEFDIYFDRGIDDFGGWLRVLKDYNMVKQGGSWYTYTRENGDEIKFLSKDWNGKLEDDQNLKDEVYNKICDKVIMEYKVDNFGIDDLEHTDETPPTG